MIYRELQKELERLLPHFRVLVLNAINIYKINA
jgi:hypothetical protein